MALQAEVLVFLFSGRENPSWFLSTAETEEVLALLKHLKPSEPGTKFRREGLGYRGFDLRWREHQEGNYSRLSAYGGLVLLHHSLLLADSGRTIERRLAGTSHGRTERSVEEALQSALR